MSTYPRNDKKTITWSSGANNVELDLKGNCLAGVAFPSALTNTTVALEISFDNGVTWFPIQERDGTAITFAPTAIAYQFITPNESYGSHYSLRLKGGSNEAADRSLIIVSTPLVTL